jgi:hypothetical protein
MKPDVLVPASQRRRTPGARERFPKRKFIWTRSTIPTARTNSGSDATNLPASSAAAEDLTNGFVVLLGNCSENLHAWPARSALDKTMATGTWIFIHERALHALLARQLFGGSAPMKMNLDDWRATHLRVAATEFNWLLLTLMRPVS